MEIDEGINPELLSPWVEMDVEYPNFQCRAWQHEETAYELIVEQEPGPFENGQTKYQITLLPEGAENGVVIEDGFFDAQRAAHEAEALMATGTVMDNAEE